MTSLVVGWLVVGHWFFTERNICDTLGRGRYADDLIENREIYILHLYSTSKGIPPEFRKDL